ncbi:MAG: FAD:protein FMN transferase [Anaerobutyricum soehngenii]|nr:FAD:protein FMN transferase [Anaerobutyricum hallii]MDY5243605.1 FAD:protein FMN transferase [Anaerobutyricum soehngenii]
MKKQILSIIMAGCLLLSMTACSSDKGNMKPAFEQTTADASIETSSPQEYSKTDFVMSTVLSEKIYGTKDVTQDIKEELDKLEKDQLSWREDHSVVSKINADAQKGIKTKLDSDMTSWVEDSLELAKRSNGAFDPTIGRLTRLWNIEGDNPKVPSKQEIKNTLEDTGYTKIHLEKVESQNTANTKKNVDKDIKYNTAKNKETSEDTSQNTNTNESVSSIYIGDKCTLDLGAVGKGIACDVVQDYLKKQKEVSGAVIAVGGSILLYGSKADGSDWNVAVQNPRGQDGEVMGVLSLSGTTNVSTSGDYEKYFMQDGKRYHHILDPSTGYPADSGLISVTIVSDSGLLSDGLSTACFVLGKEKGEKLLETYGAEGVFIDQNKKVTVTKGLKDKFTILNKEYKQ